MSDTANKAVRICMGICILLSLLVILSWITSSWNLLTFEASYIPMAPSTAMLFIALSASVLIGCSAEPRMKLGILAYALVFLSISASLLELARPIVGDILSVDACFAPSPGCLEGFQVRRMAPLTAFSFLLLSVSILLTMLPTARRRSLRQTSSLLALAVMIAGISVIFTYLIGEPLLYGGRSIPMALLTAVLFLLLSGGVSMLAGDDVWPMSIFYKLEGMGGRIESRWSVARPLSIFLFAAIGISIVGFSFIRHQMKLSRTAAEKELSSIADLKVGQISRWYEDRMDRCRYFLDHKCIANAISELDNGPTDSDRKKIASLASPILTDLHFSRVLVFDSEGRMLSSVPEGKDWCGPTAKSYVGRTQESGKIMVSDLHQSEMLPGTIDMDFFVPMFPEAQEAGAAQRPAGVLMLEVNPGEFLFPLIQAWPTNSRTAETLLVRREGDEVVFLNELRHRKDTAFKLRFPVTPDSRLPAAMAVQGKEGTFEGADYRNVPVLSTLRAVKGTPWFMVAKIDADEVFAPLRNQARTAVACVFALIIATAFGVGFMWRRRDEEWIRKQLEYMDELERRVAERTSELAAANKSLLRQSDELKAVNRELESFSYSVSHDLKAPLRSVDGFAKIIEEDYAEKLDEEGRRLLRIIRDSAKDMGQLIGDLLEFSRMSRKNIEKSTIDMDYLVKDIFKHLSGENQGREIRLEVAVLPQIYGDPTMLRQVVMNLMSNAFKFTRKRQAAVVKAESISGEDEDTFIFRDNGVGFDMEYKDKLFGVFQRLHSAADFEGTGIGLAIVQRIIQRHGGRVWAEGKPGEGASFYFTIPHK